MTRTSPPRMRRRAMAVTAAALSLALALTAGAAAEAAKPDKKWTAADLNDATITSLQAALEAGDLTSVELTGLYVERITALNSSGPGLNAVRSLSADWKKQAQAADKRRAKGESGPLLGIPILVKDNIDVKGLPTTAGSVALAESYPAESAPSVEGLEDAGAVILGKANLLEFAGGFSFSQPQGDSSLGGETLNPYDLSINYYGSSIGSAAAVAAGLAAGALGTDTGGSMMSPASNSNLVAIRPTRGLVSRAGSIPQQDTRDVIGPMTRSVSDAAAVLSALATGEDDIDPVSALGDAEADTDFTEFLDESALEGARIGVAEGSYATLTADQQVLWDQALADLEAQGATLVPFDEKLVTSGVGDQILFAYEFAEHADDYFSRLPEDAPIRSFDELIAYIDAHPEEFKYGTSTMDTAAAIDLEADRAEYEAARQKATDETLGVVDVVREKYDLDAIVFPGSSNVYTSSLSGLPAITVPAGLLASVNNPWEISFLGADMFTDGKIIGYAYDYEQATKHWVSPFTTNAGLFRCIDTVGGDSSDPTCAP